MPDIILPDYNIGYDTRHKKVSDLPEIILPVQLGTSCLSIRQPSLLKNIISREAMPA